MGAPPLANSFGSCGRNRQHTLTLPDMTCVGEVTSQKLCSQSRQQKQIKTKVDEQRLSTHQQKGLVFTCEVTRWA
eukprot:m.12193 g.12193  ORF g.12193 m.12193 type:complete len:75 (-) comp5809_c0_seq1:245-469(-)